MPSPAPIVVEVIGSLNIDLVTRVARLPQPGETLTASSVSQHFGGKGANQAVATARLLPRPSSSSSSHPPTIRLVGALGSDSFARPFLAHLADCGVDASRVAVVEGAATGLANIVVEEASGENRIMLGRGANHADEVDRGVGGGGGGDGGEGEVAVAVYQLEVPLRAVAESMRGAKERGVKVVFNPAPAVEVPEEMFDGLDHLIVNETEAAILSGRRLAEVSSEAEIDAVAREFVGKGVRHVVVTLGGRGAFYRTAEGKSGLQTAPKVTVADTTAAGDTFLGAYVAALAQSSSTESAAEFDIEKAIGFAIKAATLTVQREGAQSSIPTLAEVQASQ